MSDAEFRESRTNALIAVTLNTFWSIAIILLGFSLWDAVVDPVNWRTAFVIRAAGAVVIIATGLFQKLPGKASWLPILAKVRLMVAIVASALAAALLDRGYGFGVAGLVVIILTGPYVAIDSRDLLKTNIAVMATLMPVVLFLPLDRFDRIGTVVFVLLAVAVSSILGRVLEASNRRAFTLERQQHRDARTDSLTGLNNRRAMEERGPIELKRSKRSGAPVSLILCDLDHFKSVNDRLGHEAGDAVLRKVGQVLQGGVRETDALGRWGGEEFMAVLVDTDAHLAAEVAERMRVAVAATTFEDLGHRLTISLGVSTQRQVENPAEAWDALIKEADLHLYRAKSAGRNCVIAPAR